MAVIYDNLENFSNYKRVFDRYKNVKVSKTKYSIKIDYGKKKVLLNANNGNDTNVNLLQLISKVKNDTKKYLEGVDMKTVKNNDIFWYYYNELADKDGQRFEVAKIDLNSAYWTKAINCGIISKETVDYFEGLEWESVKEKKSGRLKALGSLATVKNVTEYEYGKVLPDSYDLIFNENFRNIYMWICNEVAKDMQTILGMVNGVYYYWDCVFVDLEAIDKVKEIITSIGYNFTIEKDIAEVFIGQNISYFYCEKTGVKYPIN